MNSFGNHLKHWSVSLSGGHGGSRPGPGPVDDLNAPIAALRHTCIVVSYVCVDMKPVKTSSYRDCQRTTESTWTLKALLWMLRLRAWDCVLYVNYLWQHMTYDTHSVPPFLRARRRHVLTLSSVRSCESESARHTGVLCHSLVSAHDASFHHNEES